MTLVKTDTQFIKVGSEPEILTRNFNLSGLKIIDSGCGTGKVAKLMASLGAFVYGIDIPELIEKAGKSGIMDNLFLSAGTAQSIPFKNNFADMVLYFASFHHIPESEMRTALDECIRVLKPGGNACFIEPVARPGSYYDLTRLVDDEAEIQKRAYKIIRAAGKRRLIHMSEKFYYLERSFRDFNNLLKIYVPDEQRYNQILQKAEEIVKSYNENPVTLTFRSFCRLNILEKVQ